MGGGAVIKMIELCPDNILASSIFAADDLRSQTNWLPACAATTAPECKLHSHLFDKTNTADNDDNDVDDRVGQSVESAPIALAAIFLAHSAYFNNFRQKIPYFYVSRQKRV